MSGDPRSATSATKSVGWVLVAVIALNVLPRVIPLPDIDLPSISFPDFPAWVDTTVSWAHTALKVKNWLLVAVVVVVILGLAVDQLAKDRKRRDT